MNPKTLQYLMGHADITVTLNVYTHASYTNFTPNDCKNTKNYEDLCQDTLKSNMAETEIKESGETLTNPDKSRVYKEL